MSLTVAKARILYLSGSSSGRTQFSPLSGHQGYHAPEDVARSGLGGEPLQVLIVEPTLTDALLAVSALSGPEFHVTVVESFLEGKTQLSSRRPALLITELQLREYNGLHLVLHGTSIRPGMAAIVMAHRYDPTLRAQAERMGATFMLKPVTQAELLAAVARTVLRSPYDSAPITQPFERRTVRTRRVREDMGDAAVERRRGERRSRRPRFMDRG